MRYNLIGIPLLIRDLNKRNSLSRRYFIEFFDLNVQTWRSTVIFQNWKSEKNTNETADMVIDTVFAFHSVEKLSPVVR